MPTLTKSRHAARYVALCTIYHTPPLTSAPPPLPFIRYSTPGKPTSFPLLRNGRHALTPGPLHMLISPEMFFHQTST